MQGAMMGLGMAATPGGAAMQFAVSVEEAELFSGVPDISAEPEAPGIPGTAPAAPGEAGTSELRQEVSSSARG
eukprot:scaffold67121_cov30-Phaeocystis_antarctica.AAC.1